MLGVPFKDRGVKVKTIHEVLIAVAKDLRLSLPRNRVGRDECATLVQHLRRRNEESPALRGWTPKEIADEIGEVILGRAYAGRKEYLEADRAGRGRRLTRTDRSYLWDVQARLMAATEKAGGIPWDAIPGRVLAALKNRPVAQARYRGVVIDEIQDFTPSMIACILELQARRKEGMLVLGDAAQNVFQRGFRWKDLGLAVAGGEAVILRETFRSTPAIVHAATPLIACQADRLEDDLVLPETAGRHSSEGPMPTIHLVRSEVEELEWIAQAVRSLVVNGVPACSIGILVRGSERRRKLGVLLTERLIPHENCHKAGGKSIDVTKNSAKILSPESAKGLEFPALIIAGVTERDYPSQAPDGDTDIVDRARRLLYTAMLRSGWSLYMVAVKGSESGLLRGLSLQAV
jgi:superfamily I DNA/RNA helicase